MGFSLSSYSPLRFELRRKPSTICSVYFDTGYSVLGFANNKDFELKVMISHDSSKRGVVYWSELYVLDSELPFLPDDYILLRSFHGGSNGEEVFRLESFLLAIHDQSYVSIELERFLHEVGIAFNLEEVGSSSFMKDSIELSPLLTENDYYVSDIFSYGRVLTVTLSKRLDGSTVSHLVETIDYRPLPDGNIGKAYWRYDHENRLSGVWKQELNKLGFKVPDNVLTELGQKAVLKHFEWSKLAKMTPKEAKQARLEVVAKNLHLRDTPRELAKLLQKEELYSMNTSIGQIEKSVLKLMEEIDNR